jgi:cell wall-associated NlpC family hydrolase
MGYKGRHRAPTNTQLRSASIAVAAAAATTVLVPGTASAAPASAWDKLAQCESSGNWRANTGNGYYGGLQFLPSTWRAYGGKGMPHKASKAEQIRVAERTLAGQGWNAWPQCSYKAGVRGFKAAPGPKVVRKALTSSTATYTVKPGDTLSKIAAISGQSAADVFAANRGVLTNPDTIFPGQKLNVAPKLAGDDSPTNVTAAAVVPTAVQAASGSLSARIVTSARSYTGRDIQYVKGGKSAKTGFDCSGFVWQVLKDSGLDVGYKNSWSLRDWATPVSKANAKAGDLVWWPGHVGVYVGNGRVVDAGNSKKDISERAIWGSPVFLRVYR